MRDGNGVQSSNAAAPQIGRDDFLAHIEVRTASASHTAGIEQERLALGCDDEQRVALAYVDGRDLQYTRAATASVAGTNTIAKRRGQQSCDSQPSQP